MNTRVITREYRLSYWAGRMRAREESGLSVKAYCAREGFRPNLYYYWQRKLREATISLLEVNGSEATPAAAASGARTGFFAEVRLTERAAVSSTLERTKEDNESKESDGVLHIEACGIRITADKAYPAVQLAELLREVTRAC